MYAYKINHFFSQSVANTIQPMIKRPSTNCTELTNVIGEISCPFHKNQPKYCKIASSLLASLAITISLSLGIFYLCQACSKIGLYVTVILYSLFCSQ